MGEKVARRWGGYIVCIGVVWVEAGGLVLFVIVLWPEGEGDTIGTPVLSATCPEPRERPNLRA